MQPKSYQVDSEIKEEPYYMRFTINDFTTEELKRDIIEMCTIDDPDFVVEFVDDNLWDFWNDLNDEYPDIYRRVLAARADHEEHKISNNNIEIESHTFTINYDDEPIVSSALRERMTRMYS